MSLDVYLELNGEVVYSRNITHNLNIMAEAAGLYYVLWRPEEIDVTTAAQAIQLTKEGLIRLVTDKGRFLEYNSPNGWGKYENLVEFVVDYLYAMQTYPEAKIIVSR